MLADVIDHIEFKTDLQTDGLTMSIYSVLMVAGAPIYNAVFSAILSVSGYNQNAVAEGVSQGVAAQNAISISYIWVETVAYTVCAVLIFLWTVEKGLLKEQSAIAARKAGN